MQNAQPFHLGGSSSDEENTETSSVSSVNSSESDISSFWLHFTDDEDDNAEGNDSFDRKKNSVRSKQEKSLESIATLCATTDVEVDIASWKSALKSFTDLRTQVENHVDRYQEMPDAFTDLLEDLLQKCEQALDGKSRKDFKRAIDYTSVQGLVESIHKANTFVAAAAARLAAGEPADQEDGDDGDVKEMTEEEYAAKLSALSAQRKNKATSLNRIASKCRAKGYSGLEVTALAMHVYAVIDEESSSNYMSLAKWNIAFRSASLCVERILAKPQMTIADDISSLRSDRAGIEGGLEGIVTALYTQLVRAAQWIPVDSNEYLPLPSCENRLAALADAVLVYYLDQKSRRADRHAVATAALLMDILGYRPPKAHTLMYRALKDEWDFVTESVLKTVEKLMNTLAQLECDDEIAMRGVCYLAYQRGLAGQYRQGRDLLLRSGAEGFVMEAVNENNNYELAVLFNRTIAQLALAAFIATDIPQAYRLIGTLWSCRDPDAQLGQKMGGRRDERDEVLLSLRDLLVPAHLRIPYEHLEMVAMLSALAVDTLAEAQNPYEQTKLQAYFYRTVTNRRQQLVGKPSSVAEQVACAYRSLKTGDYHAAKDVVESMSAWSTLPDGDRVRAQYLECLKERALQIFCYVNRCNFSTFSVEQLALKYELSEGRARDVMSQCIADSSNALTAFWDRDDKYLVVDRNNMSRLQHLVFSTATSMSNLDPFTERRVRATDARGRGRGRGRGGARGGFRGGRA